MMDVQNKKEKKFNDSASGKQKETGHEIIRTPHQLGLEKDGYS